MFSNGLCLPLRLGYFDTGQFAFWPIVEIQTVFLRHCTRMKLKTCMCQATEKNYRLFITGKEAFITARNCLKYLVFRY